jgi:hypothetical protein
MLFQIMTAIAGITTAITHSTQQQNSTLFDINYIFCSKFILYKLRDPNLYNYSIFVILMKKMI